MKCLIDIITIKISCLRAQAHHLHVAVLRLSWSIVDNAAQTPAASEEKNSDSGATSEFYEAEAILDHTQGKKILIFTTNMCVGNIMVLNITPFANFDDVRIVRTPWRQQKRQFVSSSCPG